MIRLPVSRTVDAGGVPLAVVEAGHGGRPLLLIHGFTGSKEDFTPFFDRLADAGWHAAAFDLRGHGDSGKPTDPSAYSIERMAADAFVVLDALGWARAAVLGHSLGGMVAQEVALASDGASDGTSCGAGSRTAALVLMDTAHGVFPGVTPELAALGVSVVRDGGMEAWIAATADGGVAPSGPDADLRRRDPAYAAWCDGKTRVCAPAMVEGIVPAIAHRRDRLADLAGLRCPMLVIVGEADAVVDDARRMADAVPGARLAVIPGGGHCPQFESPDAWWDALSGFLAALDRDGRDG